MKKKYRYMHLLDGTPADFRSGMILRVGHGTVKTYPDLETLKKHRRTSTGARIALGWSLSVYSHVRVEV